MPTKSRDNAGDRYDDDGDDLSAESDNGQELSALPTTMRHVALLIETTGAYGRGLLRGVARYNRLHGGWSTYCRPHALTDPPPAWLKDWKGDGILARIETKEMHESIRKLDVPVVNLRAVAIKSNYPQVLNDNEKIAELAAQHLIERGLSHFGFAGRPRGGNPALDQRADEFCRIVTKSGGTCDTYTGQKTGVHSWEEEQAKLADWLESLPKPVGVMAANDERGLQVLDACRRANLAVPDVVAVIGCDNDEPLCELSIPPMTSVDVNAEGIGYEAAALLDKMMSGEKTPSKTIRIAPRAVVTRRSTDVLACEDDEVRRAVGYIRESACRGLQVSDVLAHMGMSRASLQQRMKQFVGRTIHQEIQRVRLAMVKQRLVGSSDTIKQIARESGFASVQYMTRVFRAMTGETPARFRSRRAK